MGEEKTLVRKPHDSGTGTLLDISRLNSFANLQLVTIAASIRTRSTRLQKTIIKNLYDTRRLKLGAIAAEFLVVFYCQGNLERYMWNS